MQKTQPQTQIVGNYTISESETEEFEVGEKYRGKGYFTVANDLYSKYIAPGFSKTDLSIKPYIVGKILHGFISAFYTIILIEIFKI